MTDKKKSLDELKGAVQEGEGFDIEKGLADEDLEAVAGGECRCMCSVTSSCGGGGGGGSSAFDNQ